MVEDACLFSGLRIFGSEMGDCCAYSRFFRWIQPIVVEMYGLLPGFTRVSFVLADNRLFLVD